MFCITVLVHKYDKMNKVIATLLVLSVFCSANAGKEVIEPNSKEAADSAENIKIEDEDESASIEVEPKTVDKGIEKAVHDDNLVEERFSKVPESINSTQVDTKYSDDAYEDLIGDSADLEPKNKHDDPDYSNQKEEITIVIEDKAYDTNENEEENGSEPNKDENNWRSAENSHSGAKEYSNEDGNEEISFEEDNRDYNVESYINKKNIGLHAKDRMEQKKAGRREPTMSLMQNHYGPSDEQRILDSVPMRRFGEIVVPRLRPTLTRNGIIYTPTLITMQTASPIIEQHPIHNWLQNRPHMNTEGNILNRPRNNRLLSIPHYEIDSKQIDDYNDYGSNGYSYTPIKLTTQAPHQIIPNKFDIFKKLADASNHPNLSKRMYDDNLIPSNYYPQQKYSETYGPYAVGRLHRDTQEDQQF